MDFFGLFFSLFLAMLGLCCCAQSFSSCGEQGLLFVAVHRLLTVVAPLVAEHRLQACGLQQLWLAGSRAQAQQLWHTGLVAPWHVGSSWNRDRTHVPCIGRWILNHCTTREDPGLFLIILNFEFLIIITKKIRGDFWNNYHREGFEYIWGNIRKVVLLGNDFLVINQKQSSVITIVKTARLLLSEPHQSPPVPSSL